MNLIINIIIHSIVYCLLPVAYCQLGRVEGQIRCAICRGTFPHGLGSKFLALDSDLGFVKRSLRDSPAHEEQVAKRKAKLYTQS